MKNLIFKIVLTTFLFVMLGCSSNDDDVNTNDDGTFLTAKVDGVDFEVRGFLFAVTSTIGAVQATLMGATYDDDSKTINMAITNLNSIGTYSLLQPSNNDDAITTTYVSGLIYGEGDSAWLATSFIDKVSGGTITITEYDGDYLIGTFQFTGFEIESKTERSITDGRFKFKKLQAK